MKWSNFGIVAAKRGHMNTLGFMVILGKDERAKFEMQRELFSNEVEMIYDEATTFHDGKWIMFELKNTELFNDMERLLLIKRKPNRKINI